MPNGEAAETLVYERLRAALPADYRIFRNVAWLERTADNRGLRDGEADVVVAHPERGFLVMEVKAGEIARDAYGRWFAGARELKPSPFEQARTSMHALLRKLDDLPDRPSDFRPIAGHAVAFPDVDLASAGN
ncbi:MAG TPA: nuclease-related domain-containing protein, partial [Candidatus Limnocylindrales bacterium]|nr:nuclease-related domain-containing protein [Candidatus Limnocylindrales bacterium]